ncbi:MAG: bifunctional hydroxymethylpyrimidine kinase/phosphomethylpyrimidine kinase [Wenzhouxiangellaceae bacterium]
MPEQTVAKTQQSTPSSQYPTPAALTIAGSDSSGGAGIQVDLRSFQRQQVYGCTAITAVTAQNGVGVQALEILPAALVREQLVSILQGIPVAAAKTGMLGHAAIIQAVAECWRDCDIPLVVDPVMVATSGASLLPAAAIDSLRQHLLPLATLVTPNLPELAALTALPVEQPHQRLAAATRLLELGCDAVLIKDGHGGGAQVNDVLFDGDRQWRFTHPRLTGEYHGTGCASSAAICAALARGLTLADAVEYALDDLHQRLQSARPSLCGAVHYIW